MYVRDPARVVVTGPLEQHATGFCVQLGHSGYTPKSAAEVMQLVAHLSRWMSEARLVPADLTEEVVCQYLVERRRRYRKRLTVSALRPLLVYLRGMGAAPAPSDAGDDDETAALLADYRQYLLRERGLATLSIRRYLPPIRAFLIGVPAPLNSGLSGLTAEHVIMFVMEQAARRTVADAKSMVTAVRSLLRFLFVTGRIARPLADAVPTVVNRKLSSLPARLAAGQADVLLNACDRTTVAGRRDYAALLMLIRLGLRACEVAAMQTTDIDWRAGEITVRGKGDRVDVLPLPPDVGQAVVDYLTHGRAPAGAARALFVAQRPPRQGLSPGGVRAIVAHVCRRAGVPRIASHRLRHTVASDLLDAGASLPEVGQLLRHRSNLSTAIYAKVDRRRLRTLAQPWPAGA